MTEPSAIDAASKRLALALDALAAAVERRHEADRGEQTLDAQLHALGADRSRLASELDAAAARTRTLEIANREVAQRLDAAIDTIRSVPAAKDRGGLQCGGQAPPSPAANSAGPARRAKRRVSCAWRRISTRASWGGGLASARSAIPASPSWPRWRSPTSCRR